MLERLEPRILLSGHSLFNIVAPDYSDDALLEDTQQIVEYTELQERKDQIEEQTSTAEQDIIQVLDASDILEGYERRNGCRGLSVDWL